jgi:hypothetical protein
MRRIFSVLCAIVIAAATVAAQNPPQQNLPEESDQLNFWIGTWRVGSVGTATDKVKKLGDGIAILEKYEFGGTKGWSINVFDSTTGTWTQTWHTTAGVYIQFTGKKEGDRIVLVAGTGNELLRLSFIEITRDSFTQLYESSHDGGQTWVNPNRVPFVRMK